MNQHLIEQYVTGKMSEAEADAFEVSCISNPELARQVELEQRLKAGLNWRWLTASSGQRARRPGAGHRRQRFDVSVPEPVLETSARRADADPPRWGEEQRQGTSMRLALVRGADSMPHLPAGAVRVEIVGLFDPGFHYTIALDHIGPAQNIATVATLYGQHPTSPVTLEVMVDGEQLDAGSYFLRVLKQASDEEALDFPFARD
jgi:hypothetical protein